MRVLEGSKTRIGEPTKAHDIIFCVDICLTSIMNTNTSVFMKVVQCSFVAALFLILFSQPAFAIDAGNGTVPSFSPELDTIITSPKYDHCTWGIMFEDLETGEVIYEFNADKLFTPASVTKLYSSAVALDTLGANYQFRTPIYRTGEIDESGNLEGNLILVASGDTTMGGRNSDGNLEYTSFDHCDANAMDGAILTEQDPLNGLNQLAKQVANSGISNVSDVIVDSRLFEEMKFEEYVVSPIMINDNFIDIIITPTNEGKLAKVEWRPRSVLYNVSSSVETVASGSQAQIEITSGTGTIHVEGKIPAGNDPLVRVCQVENPAAFARSLLIEALEREGVEVTAPSLSDNPSEKLPDSYSNLIEVAVLESLPFSENIELILKVSQNVHADTLPFLVGAQHGTKDFYEGIHAGLPFFLGAGIDANEISFGDGRGYDRSDLVTPRATVKLLRYMSNCPGFEHYYSSLPIMGVDGSLAMIENEVVQGKVRAKTGTILTWDALSFRLILLSKALAGYINTTSGRQLAFSMFVSDVPIAQIDDMYLIMNDQAKICERVYEYHSCDNLPFNPGVEREMVRIVEVAMAENNIPGAIVGVWVPGEGTLIKAIGTADIETGRNIKITDKMRIASITKTFTATVILQLVDEGKLALNDTLDHFVPEVPNSDEITIRQLCDMTCGIYSITDDEDFDDILANEPLKKWTHQELLDIALKHDPYFAPGEGWYYSDTDYSPLLGMIIEQVTGNTVENEIQTRIIEPLELLNTSFPTGPNMTGEYSRGYMVTNDTGVLEDITETDPSAPWTGGAMISNLYDLKTWVNVLEDGELLSEEAHKEQLTWIDMPGMAAIDGKYGLGISSIAGFVGHNGEILGYNSAMYHHPTRNATIIVLLNKCRPGEASVADEIFGGIVKILFPDVVPL